MIPKDHPSLVGHFPNNPIVPGVVILGEVLNALRKGNGSNVKVLGVPSMKFLSPLRPGEALVILLQVESTGEATFTCTSRGRTIATGRLAYRVGVAAGNETQ